MGSACGNIGKHRFRETQGSLKPGDCNAEGGADWAITHPILRKGLGLVKPLEGEKQLVAKATKKRGGIVDGGRHGAGKTDGRQIASGGPRVEGVELGLGVMCILKGVSNARKEHAGVKNQEVGGSQMAGGDSSNTEGDTVVGFLILCFNIAGRVCLLYTSDAADE